MNSLHRMGLFTMSFGATCVFLGNTLYEHNVEEVDRLSGLIEGGINTSRAKDLMDSSLELMNFGYNFTLGSLACFGAGEVLLTAGCLAELYGANRRRRSYN